MLLVGFVHLIGNSSNIAECLNPTNYNHNTAISLFHRKDTDQSLSAVGREKIPIRWAWEFKHPKEKEGFGTRGLVLCSDSRAPSGPGPREKGQHVMQRSHRLRAGQPGPRLCLADS